ncbi:hypothetical protein [Clostridium baratii]|uniref:hypothetical protein n=1 Tax=Clostridium baratii TaxID=1561 RepID=UPI002903379D|nr:hypothetical protein [Clostridium baratii]MDU1052571.1 hypothetical protein [Clostridium baratii]
MSKKLLLAYLAIIVGGLTFSLELIGLQILQSIGHGRLSDHIFNLPVLLAFCITIAIIVFGMKIALNSNNTDDE